MAGGAVDCEGDWAALVGGEDGSAARGGGVQPLHPARLLRPTVARAASKAARLEGGSPTQKTNLPIFYLAEKYLSDLQILPVRFPMLVIFNPNFNPKRKKSEILIETFQSD